MPPTKKKNKNKSSAPKRRRNSQRTKTIVRYRTKYVKEKARRVAKKAPDLVTAAGIAKVALDVAVNSRGHASPLSIAQTILKTGIMDPATPSRIQELTKSAMSNLKYDIMHPIETGSILIVAKPLVKFGRKMIRDYTGFRLPKVPLLEGGLM